MTPSDFLSAWAARPESEMFFGVKFDEQPYAVARIKAGHRASYFEKLGIHPNFVGHAKVASIKGVTCLVIEGEVAAPWEAAASNHRYYAVVAPTDVFGT